MSNNSKLTAIFSILILIAGFSLIWIGFQSNETPLTAIPLVTASPVVQASSQVALPTNQPATLGLEGEQILITKVVDGDTVQLNGGQTVRLIGIDTPETVDPRRPVGCFGKEASNKTKELLEGKIVILQKDVSETDKYKRLLRYIYLPLESGDYLFVNDYLIREGFAKSLTYPPDVKYSSQFLQAEKEAKENQKGLWGSC